MILLNLISIYENENKCTVTGVNDGPRSSTQEDKVGDDFYCKFSKQVNGRNVQNVLLRKNLWVWVSLREIGRGMLSL